MTNNTKRKGLLFLFGALASLVLLAGSLSNLHFHAGTPFPSGGNSESENRFFVTLPPLETYSLPILKGIFSLIFLILMIYVPVRLLTLVNKKKVLQLIGALIILFLIVLSIPPVATGRHVNLPEESSILIDPPTFEYPTSPLGRPPQELIWLVIIGLVLGTGVIAIKILKQRLYLAKVADQLSQEAAFAVSAIKAGSDLGSVIIRCYLQMTRALQEERGIERIYNMTAQEFEETLELKGFPTVPVHQLTRLFEKVRYGEQQIMKNDEEAAVESLNEIIRFCRNGRN